MSEPIKTGFWQALFDWLAKNLPSLLAAFGVGYKIGRQGVNDAEKEALKLKHELEKKKNEDVVEANHAGMSDSDIVMDAIKQGSDKPK